MTPKEVDRELLLAYLEGSCSPEQLRQIREYLRDEAYRDSLHRFMEEEWVSLGRVELPSLPGMEERYAGFQAVHKAPVSRRPPIRTIRWTVAAAAVLVFCLVGFWLLPGLFKRQGGGAPPQWLSWHNGPGRHGAIMLPDSSRVYLGPASTLWYSQSSDRSRLVRLEGEAYFIVRHDRERPFTVETGALNTLDVGTEFNIRYYPAEPDIEVAVVSGKVQVRHLNGHDTGLASILSPGQLLQYNTATRQSGITSLSNAALIGAWRNGILSFRRQPLKEVTGELERFYGARFQYTDPAAENILITTVLDNKSLEDALDIVSLTAGVEFTRQDSLVLVK
jgi:ferric-dicitrate binding protein FerR (iron transport regulator)